MSDKTETTIYLLHQSCLKKKKRNLYILSWTSMVLFLKLPHHHIPSENWKKLKVRHLHFSVLAIVSSPVKQFIVSDPG